MSIPGVAILDTSLLPTIPLWFDKHINLASGVSFSGSSVGPMIAPFFILYFSDLYSVRGAYIMIAAVWMQVVYSSNLFEQILYLTLLPFCVFLPLKFDKLSLELF